MSNNFDPQIRQRINPISQKVIDDLSELGRYGNIRQDPLEIAAYVLNTETNLFSNSFRNGQDDNNLLFDQVNPLIIWNRNKSFLIDFLSASTSSSFCHTSNYRDLQYNLKIESHRIILVEWIVC